MLWHDEGVSSAHVGDSRLYLLRGGELRQLTRDHSIVQEQVERGAMSLAEARNAPQPQRAHARASASIRVVEADVRTAATEPGDVYLLCSDGLTDMLDRRARSRQRCSSADRDPLAAAAQRLVERRTSTAASTTSRSCSRVIARRRGGRA